MAKRRPGEGRRDRRGREGKERRGDEKKGTNKECKDVERIINKVEGEEERGKRN